MESWRKSFEIGTCVCVLSSIKLMACHMPGKYSATELHLHSWGCLSRKFTRHHALGMYLSCYIYISVSHSPPFVLSSVCGLNVPVCLNIYLLWNIWIFFSVVGITGNATVNILAQVFLRTCIFISVGIMPENAIAGLCGDWIFHLIRKHHTFPEQLHHFIPLLSMWDH